MRALALCLLLATLLPAAALAAEASSVLRAQPGEQASPADGTWPLGARTEPAARVEVRPHPDLPGGFLLEVTPVQAPANAMRSAAGLRVCAGLASSVRRDLYKTRAVELRIRASRPAPGILVITSSDTQNRASRERSFGSFVIGEQWRALRLPYGTLAHMPGWEEEARRLGHAPGDLVLRPDSIEDFCLGVEPDRLPAGAGALVMEIDSLRFVR